jgi:hypothetical protein
MGNHLSVVQEIQKKRYAMLLKAWEDANYKESVEVSFDSIRDTYGWSDEDARSLMYYLREEQLLNWNNGRISLTHKGIVEIEQSITRPQKSTEHFQSQVIQHFHATVGAVQNASDSNAVINLNLRSQHQEISGLIIKLSEVLMTLTPEQRKSLGEIVDDALTHKDNE